MDRIAQTMPQDKTPCTNGIHTHQQPVTPCAWCAPKAKAPRAYFAHLDDRAGILTQVDGTIYFLDDVTDALTVITPEHVNFLVALGEVGIAEAAHAVDMARGGAAKIATTRLQEVA